MRSELIEVRVRVPSINSDAIFVVSKKNSGAVLLGNCYSKVYYYHIVALFGAFNGLKW